MNKSLIASGSVVCFLAVAIGAFGAHLFADSLQGKAADWYDTAVQYQFFHGAGLILCGLLSTELGRGVEKAGWCMLAGIIFFCGSLYMMSFGGPKWLGAVTPVGGIAFLIAWVLIFVAAISKNEKANPI